MDYYKDALSFQRKERENLDEMCSPFRPFFAPSSAFKQREHLLVLHEQLCPNTEDVGSTKMSKHLNRPQDAVEDYLRAGIR